MSDKLPVVSNPAGWVLLWEDNFALVTAQVYPTKKGCDAAREKDWPESDPQVSCPLSASHLGAIRSERKELRERVQILGSRIEDLISDRDKWKGIARDGGHSDG